MNYEDFWQEDRFKIDIESNYPISPKQKKKEKEEKKKKKQSKPRKQKIIEIKESNEVKEEYKERESRSDWWKFEETIKTEMEENKSFSSFRKGIVEKYFNIAKNIKDSNKLSELFHIRILRATDFVVDDAIRSLANMLVRKDTQKNNKHSIQMPFTLINIRQSNKKKKKNIKKKNLY